MLTIQIELYTFRNILGFIPKLHLCFPWKHSDWKTKKQKNLLCSFKTISPGLKQKKCCNLFSLKRKQHKPIRSLKVWLTVKEEVMANSMKWSHSITQRLFLSSASMSFNPCLAGQCFYFTDYIRVNLVGWWESQLGNQSHSTSAS